MRNALIVEEFQQHHRSFVGGAAAQFQKIRRGIFCDDAMDCGVDIRAEGKKGNRGNAQAVFDFRADDDLVIWKIRLFKHKVNQ